MSNVESGFTFEVTLGNAELRKGPAPDSDLYQVPKDISAGRIDASKIRPEDGCLYVQIGNERAYLLLPEKVLKQIKALPKLPGTRQLLTIQGLIESALQ